jgi:hypothetical protein
LYQPRGVAETLGVPEVRESRHVGPAALDHRRQDVCGLDVPVQDSLRVCVLERTADGQGHFRQRFDSARRPDLGERPGGDELHRVVPAKVVDLAEPVGRYDVRMAEARMEVVLELEGDVVGAVARGGVAELQRDDLVRVLGTSAEHIARASAADPLQNLEAGDDRRLAFPDGATPLISTL